SAAIRDEVANDGKRRGAERLDYDHVPVLERSHVHLARSNPAAGTVRLAVDRARAGPTDAFAAVVGKRDRLISLRGELVVHHVERFEEGHVRVQILRRIIDELAGGFRAGLTPDAER